MFILAVVAVFGQSSSEPPCVRENTTSQQHRAKRQQARAAQGRSAEWQTDDTAAGERERERERARSPLFIALRLTIMADTSRAKIMQLEHAASRLN